MPPPGALSLQVLKQLKAPENPAAARLRCHRGNFQGSAKFLLPKRGWCSRTNACFEEHETLGKNSGTEFKSSKKGESKPNGKNRAQ